MAATIGTRWWMVVIAVFGLICGPGPVNVFAFGVFLKPITAELGLSRGILTLALLVTTSIGAVMNPLYGYFYDRWGIKRVLTLLVPVYALTMVGYSLLTASVPMIFLIFGLVGCVSTVCGPIGYSILVAQWFDRERGLALGIATAGVGLGVVLIPQIAAILIGRFGWRVAYLGIGVTILVLAWLPTFFIREAVPRGRGGARIATDAPQLAGVSTKQALLRSWRFWALTIAFFLAVTAINGTLTHVVAFLTDRGISLQAATAAISVSGAAIIIGRILSGWCLDRFFGPYVAIGFFIIPIIGIALLGAGSGELVPLLGAALCGLSVGAEVDLMAFFVSRYFGLKAYGRVYGTMFAFFSVGNGLGSFIAGSSYDRLHSYAPAFLLFGGLLVVTCLLLLPLGPYPFPARERRLAPAQG